MATSRGHSGEPDFHDGRPRIAQRRPYVDQTIDHCCNNDQHEQSCKRCVDVVIEHDPAHFAERLRRCEQLTRRDCIAVFEGVADESHAWIEAEYLLDSPVVVQITSHAAGAIVTHANRSRFILNRTTVHTVRAASIWLAVPNSGHSVQMPPNGSITPT